MAEPLVPPGAAEFQSTVKLQERRSVKNIEIKH